MNFPAKQISAVALAVATLAAAPLFGAQTCKPTEADALGPFYKPGAPLRSQIGHGYVLTGFVRSAADCKPVANARIEVWQAGLAGRYDDAHRATLLSDAAGSYRLETHFPPPYSGRPSHIHIKVEAPGFLRLVTQHYPGKGAKEANFDLVLIPAK